MKRSADCRSLSSCSRRHACRPAPARRTCSSRRRSPPAAAADAHRPTHGDAAPPATAQAAGGMPHGDGGSDRRASSATRASSSRRSSAPPSRPRRRSPSELAKRARQRGIDARRQRRPGDHACAERLFLGASPKAGRRRSSMSGTSTIRPATGCTASRARQKARRRRRRLGRGAAGDHAGDRRPTRSTSCRLAVGAAPADRRAWPATPILWISPTIARLPLAIAAQAAKSPVISRLAFASGRCMKLFAGNSNRVLAEARRPLSQHPDRKSQRQALRRSGNLRRDPGKRARRGCLRPAVDLLSRPTIT